jgi:hypothetical protein
MIVTGETEVIREEPCRSVTLSLKPKNKLKVFFCPVPPSPDFRKSIAFLEGSQPLPICPSGNSIVWIKMSAEHW